MRDFLSFDCAPTDEPCVQVSKDNDYMPEMKREAIRFKALLEKVFPRMDEYGVWVTIAMEGHDFGNYLSLRVWYNDQVETSLGYAYFIENNLPETWESDFVRNYEPKPIESY